MRPGDLIGFLFIGACMLVVIVIVALIFRKRKKVTFVISTALLLGYAIYFFAFPSIQASKHQKSYVVLSDYLQQQYPTQTFDVIPEEYELGIAAGDFYINDVRTPNRGVMMRVKDNKQVVQIATWSNTVEQQEDVWQELLLHYKETYQLGQPIDQIQKLAYYEDGRFTVFGLKVDENLAIAVYDYFEGGYGLERIEEFSKADVVHLIHNDQLLVFVTSENAAATIEIPLENGEKRLLDVTPNEAQLLVEDL